METVPVTSPICECGRMMMMADGLLGPCSDQVIEGVTVKVDSDPETEDDISECLPNGYAMDPNTMSSLNQQQLSHPQNLQQHHSPYQHSSPEEILKQEIVETVSVPHLFSTTSAACANCSISFFDPIGNPVYQPIFYMCLDSGSNEAIQISSVIHILFAKKLSRCPKPSTDLALCSKCAELVARMYQLYRELDGLSAINSYINSFLGDINQVFLPTPESSSSNTSINYAHYEDSITAAISGSNGVNNSFSTTSTASSEMSVTTSVTQPPRFDAPYSRVAQKPMTEPPPLTYPSYYGPPRSNSFVAQEFTERKEFIPEVDLTLPEQKVDHGGILNSALSSASSHSPQQLQQPQQIQQQPIQSTPPPKTPKKRKKSPKATTSPVLQVEQREPTSTSGTSASDEKKRRVLQCTEEGCTKIYHGRGASASLRQHIKIVHLKQFPFECEICTKPIATRNMLDSHLKTHLGMQERAALPGATIPTPPRPPPPSEPSVSKPCPECGQAFQTEYILDLHMKSHKKEGEEDLMYECEYTNCSKKFREKSSLRRHEQRHVTNTNANVSNVNTNISNVNVNTNVKASVNAPIPPPPSTSSVNYYCSRCPTSFDSRKLLKAHQATCTSEDPQFACKFTTDGCKRMFKYKHHLLAHYKCSHHLSVDEAREHVYPGLSLKEWMARSAKRSKKSTTDKGKPPESMSTPTEEHAQFGSPIPSSFDAVQHHHLQQSQSSPIDLQRPSPISDLRSPPPPNNNLSLSQPMNSSGLYEQTQVGMIPMGTNQNPGGYSYQQYQQQSQNTGFRQTVSNTNQNSVFQQIRMTSNQNSASFQQTPMTTNSTQNATYQQQMANANQNSVFQHSPTSTNMNSGFHQATALNTSQTSSFQHSSMNTANQSSTLQQPAMGVVNQNSAFQQSSMNAANQNSTFQQSSVHVANQNSTFQQSTVQAANQNPTFQQTPLSTSQDTSFSQVMNTNQNSAFLFQQQMLGLASSVIQETSNPGTVGQAQHHHHQNAFQPLSTVIHQNPNTVQQNLALFHQSRPPPPPYTNLLQNTSENGRRTSGSDDGVGVNPLSMEFQLK